MLLGLTGGIGSGKSTVSNYLKELGCTIVDADLVSRQVVMPGSEALKAIEQTFGSEYILPDGNLARKELGKLVFADATAMFKLDMILSEKIGAEIWRQIEESKAEITVLDAATLIEAGYADRVDVLWIVDADDEVRIQRVMARDNAERQDVINRMNNQMSREQRMSYPCTVIDNSGTVEETRANVRKALEALSEKQ